MLIVSHEECTDNVISYQFHVQSRLPPFLLIRYFGNKTPAETFPKFPPVLRVIDRSDRNPPIIATNVTFRPSLRHPSGL